MQPRTIPSLLPNLTLAIAASWPLAAQTAISHQLFTTTHLTTLLRGPTIFAANYLPANSNLICCGNSSFEVYSSAGGAAFARVYGSHGSTATTAFVRINEFGFVNNVIARAGSSSGNTASAQHGPHVLEWRIRQTPGTRGVIAMSFGPLASNAGEGNFTGSYRIDINADGTYDAQWSFLNAYQGPFYYPVAWTTNELRVRIEANALADLGTGAGRSAYGHYVSLRYTVQPETTCTLVRNGTPCGCETAYGALLVAPYVREYSFYAQNAPANAPGVMVVGTASTSLPLPGGCTLLVAPLIAVPFTIGTNGTGRVTFRYDSTLPWMLRAQPIVLSGSTLIAGQEAVATCSLP